MKISNEFSGLSYCLIIKVHCFLLFSFLPKQLININTFILTCQQLFLFFSFFFFTEKRKRRRRDLNPRAAINDLLPFQGSPFSLLGTSPILTFMHPRQKIKPPDPIWWFVQSGEGGIRTHAPLRTNGFQDRLVMTTSIPLRN